MRAYVFALALLVAHAAQAEPAVTTRAVDLLKDAQSDADKVASLPENTRVELVKRSGAWSEVKTGTGQTGWVRMMALKPVAEGGAGGRASPGIGSQLSGLLSSGRTSRNGTDTNGVRGLQEADLQNAQANPDEFKKMQKYAASKDGAQSFAQRTKLAPAKVDYLNAPSSAPGNGSNGGNGDSTPGMNGV